MSTTVPTIAIAPPTMPLVLHGDGALGGGHQHLQLSSTFFPLTPSPTSPFRAHRGVANTTNSKPPRPKPYHRPASQQAESKLPHHTSSTNLTQFSSLGTASPFSPFTPSSLSSSLTSTPSSYGYQPSRLSHCHSAVLDDQQRHSQLHGGLQTPLSTVPSNGRQGLQRTESAPVLVQATPQSTNGESSAQPNQCSSSSSGITVPVFASSSEQAPRATSPVVFSAEYLEARLAKFGGNVYAPLSTQEQQQTTQRKVVHGVGYQEQPDILALIRDFPYAPAYVDVSTIPQPLAQQPVQQDSSVMAQAAPATQGKDEEIRKQRYAVDLIETAIKTIHKIWPETQEPEREALPGPVTSEGKLRASFVSQFDSASSSTVSPAQDKATARLRRKPSKQQFTPESSPDSSKKKRKRGESGVESEVKDGDEKVAKRSCVGETKAAYPSYPRVLTPPVEHKPEPPKAVSPPQSHHISLKLFVRELLRRSKTSCNTLEVALCYLDGIEETVKKLRDCLKLGIAFGTVAMAERGPYDEGMKDEGRIITSAEWMKQEAMKQEDDGMDVRGDWPHQQGQEWAPLSPASDSSSDKAAKSSTPAVPPTQVLATHPLLDARRTFLASLVLATKFIQDKAYSNKAWAKLSGLAGKEVGRCERALGGALQWRLWVGKDCGASSSIRGRSPFGNEEVESLCSGDSETMVHGENDPLAKAFMEEAMKKQKEKWGSEADFSSPANMAPAEVVARLYGDGFTNSRAGVGGRARTWHAPEKSAEEVEALDVASQLLAPQVSLQAFSAVTSSSALSIASASTLLDQLSTFNLSTVTPFSQASQTTVAESQSSAAAFGMQLVHSPLSLEGERFLSSLLKGEECEAPATVKMNVDDSNCGKNKTPTMSMATSFVNNEPLLCAGFLDTWQSQTTFPFTFTAAVPSKAQPQQLARLAVSKQPPQRSHSVGSLPLPRLLHPQTAALRASAGSGSSSSPHSSSTFSSPEVLTPLHSRANTLVDVAECYQDWMVGGARTGKEFQQCVDQLYCGVNGAQFGGHASVLQL